MADSKSNNNWGLYSIRKVFEYGLLVVGIWKFGIPAAEAWYVQQREAYDIKHKKEPFRKLTSQEMGIPADRVHIVIGEWWKDHKEHEELVNAVYPLLESEVNNIRPRLEILPGGRAKWHHKDGQVYDASIGPDGFHWFFLNGEWLPCKF